MTNGAQPRSDAAISSSSVSSSVSSSSRTSLCLWSLLAAMFTALACGSTTVGGHGKTLDAERSVAVVPVPVRIQSASRSIPVQVAIAKGFFAEEGLKVVATPFTSSKVAYRALDHHDVDLLITSADNVVTYRLNARNPLDKLIDAQIVFGHDMGLGLALVALPRFTTVESLRGHAIAVDAPDSGFALVVNQVMARHGMKAGLDYQLVARGGSPDRLKALQAGTAEAAVINADAVVRATYSDHFPVLARVSDVADPYLGGVGVAHASWLAANPEVATRFIRAFVRAVRWVKAPAHRADVIALLVDGSTPPDVAAQIYEAAATRPTGLATDAGLSLDGLAKVIAIRNELGGFHPPQADLAFLVTPASGIYNLSFWRRAIGGGPATVP